MSDGFPAVLEAVAGVEGWLSDDQAERLWQCGRRVPPGGTIVEIGSYRGRSTIVLARSAAGGVRVIAIDPHAGGDRGPQEIRADARRGESDNQAFVANLEAAGVAPAVEHIRLTSDAALAATDGAIDLLYVDGAHRLRPAAADIGRWGARVAPGGTMLIHDAFSSIGVTLALAAMLFLGRDFLYAGRSRSLAEYRRTAVPLTVPERGRNALRQLAELPWFARNVAIKLALVARLRPLATALGHPRGDGWPY